GPKLAEHLQPAGPVLAAEPVEGKSLRVVHGEAADDPRRVVALPALDGVPVFAAHHRTDDVVALQGAKRGAPVLGLRLRVGPVARDRVGPITSLQLSVAVRMDV